MFGQSYNFKGMPLLWWFKSAAVVIALIFGVLFTLPTFLGDSKTWKRDSVGRAEVWYQALAESFLPDSRISLGLDLKGGLSLTLNVDVNKSVSGSLNRAMQRAKELAAEKGLEVGAYEISDDFVIKVAVDDEEKAKQFSQYIGDQTTLMLFDRFENNTLFMQPSRPLIESFDKQIMQQAINTIRNRIDQFGVAEPNIFQAGDSRIVVELPGMTNSERAKQLIGNTAQLDFRLVLNDVEPEKLEGLLNEARHALHKEASDHSATTIDELSHWLREQKKIPLHATILLQRDLNVHQGEGKTFLRITPFLVEAHSRLAGDLIQEASSGQSAENYLPEFAVFLRFKPLGAKIFGELTKEALEPKNAPHQIAIVLDGNIQSAPVVNTPILDGSARITMGRAAMPEIQMKEAEDLALVLRSGALPATVKIVEEKLIGPSEGAQNIQAGVISTLIAALLVIVLMIIIYGLSGLVANVAMLLNVLLILAFLAIFGATLTLPGIAGIVLTMAIAVDGNVIINERIREELRSGKSQKEAFYRGYSSSFKTLIDAHVTSAVAGIFLVAYGNPTVKGFAVTLLAGIICTLFTSYYVTEVIGQWLVEKTKIKRFS